MILTSELDLLLIFHIYTKQYRERIYLSDNQEKAWFIVGSKLKKKIIANTMAKSKIIIFLHCLLYILNDPIACCNRVIMSCFMWYVSRVLIKVHTYKNSFACDACCIVTYMLKYILRWVPCSPSIYKRLVIPTYLSIS